MSHGGNRGESKRAFEAAAENESDMLAAGPFIKREAVGDTSLNSWFIDDCFESGEAFKML